MSAMDRGHLAAIIRTGRIARAESHLREALAAAAEELGPEEPDTAPLEERVRRVEAWADGLCLRATLDDALESERSAELAVLASILDSTSSLVDLIGYGPDPHLVAAAKHLVDGAAELALYIAHHHRGPLPPFDPDTERSSE